MTAIRMALAVALLWSAGATCAAFGQTARAGVEVKRLTDDDLRRTAHRLRTSVERLHQARHALQVATEQLQEVEPNQLGAGSSTPGLWVRIHRLEAPERLESMIAERSRQVSDLQEAADYQALTQWALQVASELAPLHPPRALQAIESWPAPPRWLGEQASQVFEKLQAGLERTEFADDFAVDPAGTLRSLISHPSGWSRFYSHLKRMRRNQDREEANRLIDELLTEISQKPVDARSPWQYASLIQQAGSLPHDRTAQLHEGLISAIQQSGQNRAESQTFLFDAEGQEVELQQEEFQFLQTLRRFHRQPETILKLVDSWPSMRDKLDQLGGLDRAMQANPTKVRRPGNPEADSYPLRNRSATNEWIGELKFDALSRPWKVHQRLDQKAEQGEGFFELLIQISYMSASDSPELAQLTLERAEPLIEQAEDPQSELMRFMQYANCYANLEGTLTAKLVQHGLSLLERLKQAQQEGSLESAKPSRRGYGSSENAESFLVGHLARINFAEALAEARSREDPAQRLRLLLAIVERLVH